ncbi:unnamed protein product [Didymodactylos carnosus]|uniref:Uncharacterized protein n=1 Tax=Didymodactylos carnosus TaxID=1234261 RepID=A0A816AQP6_9BILA|nr:unnamed protein product [Didymodactylos carnosus]CAF4477704.1 unnamed protein product [Didymodactylos carnosus]
MSSTGIDQFKQHIQSLISINTFFSTTSSLDIALIFASGSSLERITTNKPVIFSIEVNSFIENTRPYANVNLYSAYEEEDEILLALGLVFKVEKIDFLSVNDNVQVIHLKMIDENDLPQENLSNDLSQLFAEQVILDPIYVLLGLNDLFKVNEQSEQIKSILEGFDVQFFHNTDDLNAHTKLRRAIQSFLIFIDNRLYIPERYQQFRTYRVNFRSIFKEDFNIFY